MTDLEKQEAEKNIIKYFKKYVAQLKKDKKLKGDKQNDR